MFASKISQALFGPFPRFKFEDFVLREIENKDVERYFKYMSRKEMIPFLTNDNRPTTLEKAEKELLYWQSLYKNKRSFYWGIATPDDDKLIGTIGFNIISIAHVKGEISYDLDPDFWGKGIMSRALESLLKFADEKLALVRIQATVASNNERSLKMLKRCGFDEEGLMKKFEIINGQHKDYYLYARTK